MSLDDETTYHTRPCYPKIRYYESESYVLKTSDRMILKVKICYDDNSFSKEELQRQEDDVTAAVKQHCEWPELYYYKALLKLGVHPYANLDGSGTVGKAFIYKKDFMLAITCHMPIHT